MAIDITGYATVRNDLMLLADKFNGMRLELVALQRQINEGILALVNASEKMLVKGLGERDAEGELRSEYKPRTNVEAVVEHMQPGRKCSLCKEPGHTARTCVNGRKVEVNDDGDVVKPSRRMKQGAPTPVKKRKMKPLSPERKAQLAESLKKARAARKGKS
jgi:hypothetical protein